MKESDRPTLVLERILPVPPAAVFRAWTDPDSLRVFMCAGDFTSAAVDADVRVGGRFRSVMREPGRDVEHTGEYRTVDPPRRLAFSWVSPATGPAGSLVTIDLSPHASGTRLVLTHERLPNAEIVERHNRGWTSILEKLERHLGTARAV